jgi:hypothetical protein
MPRFYPVVLDLDDLEPGSVLLPHGADERAVEAALAGVGIYAPRGPEIVEWGDRSILDDPNTCDPIATIYDALGEPIVHLFTFPVSIDAVRGDP